MSDTLSIATKTFPERRSEVAQRAILDGAVTLLERAPEDDLTMRAVASAAGMSERTLFRYYPNHEELLDAVASEIARRFKLPPEPAALAQLLPYVDELYTSFESTRALTVATLHSQLYRRVRSNNDRDRVAALRRLIDLGAPKQPARERGYATANIRYYLSASTWHYYRFYFDFSLADTIACARRSISQTLEGLGIQQ